MHWPDVWNVFMFDMITAILIFYLSLLQISELIWIELRLLFSVCMPFSVRPPLSLWRFDISEAHSCIISSAIADSNLACLTFLFLYISYIYPIYLSVYISGIYGWLQTKNNKKAHKLMKRNTVLWSQEKQSFRSCLTQIHIHIFHNMKGLTYGGFCVLFYSCD